MTRVKAFLRRAAYHCGLLPSLHRWRNSRHLTVLMFHRVLPADSQAYRLAEREFTFTVDGFRDAMAFVKRHYSPVTLEQVRDHCSGRGPALPPCPVLVTFDDGWLDTLEQAQPILAELGVPATLFLATEAMILPGGEWWQWRLTHLLASPGGLDELEARWGLSSPAGTPPGLRVHKLTAFVAGLPDEERRQKLGSPEDASNPMMLDREGVKTLARSMSIAGHGHTHAPLSPFEKRHEDLARSFAELASMNLSKYAMSFPHGSWNEHVWADAKAVGFEMCFSSAPHLVKLLGANTGVKQPLGRIHVPENVWTCEDGRISPAKMASFLFFRAAQ